MDAKASNCFGKISMIDKKMALEKASSEVKELGSSAGDSFSLMLDEIIDIEVGWLFFYNSTEYIETSNPSSRLAGNGPFVVLNKDGEIIHLPSSSLWREELKNLIKQAKDRDQLSRPG